MRKGYSIKHELLRKLWVGLSEKCPKHRYENDEKHRDRMIKAINAHPDNEKQYEVGTTILMRLKQTVFTSSERRPALDITENVLIAICNYLEDDALRKEVSDEKLFGGETAEAFFGEYCVYWTSFLEVYNKKVTHEFELSISNEGASMHHLYNGHKYTESQTDSTGFYQKGNCLFLNLLSNPRTPSKSYMLIIHLGLGDIKERNFFPAVYQTINHDGIPVTGRMLLIRKPFSEDKSKEEMLELAQPYFFRHQNLIISPSVTQTEKIFNEPKIPTFKEQKLIGCWYLYRNDERNKRVMCAKMNILHDELIEYEGNQLFFNDGKLTFYSDNTFEIHLKSNERPLYLLGSFRLLRSKEPLKHIFCQYNTLGGDNTPRNGILLMERCPLPYEDMHPDAFYYAFDEAAQTYHPLEDTETWEERNLDNLINLLTEEKRRRFKQLQRGS